MLAKHDGVYIRLTGKLWVLGEQHIGLLIMLGHLPGVFRTVQASAATEATSGACSFCAPSQYLIPREWFPAGAAPSMYVHEIRDLIRSTVV